MAFVGRYEALFTLRSHITLGLQSTWQSTVYMRTHLIRISITVFNAIFNNISAMSWQSDLLVVETRVPGENHQPALVVIGNYKSNYHTRS